MSTKVLLVKAMVFTVVRYGCKSWSIKKAEPGRIDAFELWCWRRLLRVPWTARRSSQSILKEISPGCSLEGQMVKLQYFGHLARRIDSLEKTLMLDWQRLKAGEGDDRGWYGWTASPTQWTWVWVNSGSWWWTGKPGVLQSTGSQSWTRLRDWTEFKASACYCLKRKTVLSIKSFHNRRQTRKKPMLEKLVQTRNFWKKTLCVWVQRLTETRGLHGERKTANTL